ncbi:transcription factor bHLH36-like [Momordica charantia]|uniref:Transcription factor bHLH36-like n=1 Tax=Momordica charantia TaxID=3673 RepID=A0A6J1CHG5_MOMCH|nr:transcription factor bHLH36-like [Momordica charantia]
MFPFNQFYEFSAPEGSSCDFTTHQNLVSNSENVGRTDDQDRKIMHRDLERERRKQMASLLTNLRSLLPLEFIKGRRSRADLVNEAVRYIEHLKGKISELHIKRDALKRVYLDSLGYQNNESSSSCVVINPYSGGLEIVISCCFREEKLKLSGVMRVLLQQSTHVQSCASTKVNGRMFHTIQSKVDVSRRIDILELQRKLYQVCNFGSFET